MIGGTVGKGGWEQWIRVMCGVVKSWWEGWVRVDGRGG